MGRQFRFYLMPSDANDLADRLRDQFGAKVLPNYSRDQDLLDARSPVRENPPRGTRPATSSISCCLSPSLNKIARNYYPKPNWWVIDSDSSEVIEFSGCEFDGRNLLEGRFWYQTNILVDMQFVSKSLEFLKWAEAVYRYTKKYLDYERQIDAYLGEDALKFRENGGQLAHSICQDGRIIGPDGRIIPA